MIDAERFLASHPPFDGLDREALGRVLDGLEVAFHPLGEVVLAEGGVAPDVVHLVRRGAIVLEVGGARLVELGEGEWFGESALTDELIAPVTARAAEDTLCFHLAVDVLRPLIGPGSVLRLLTLRLRSAPTGRGRAPVRPDASAVDGGRSADPDGGRPPGRGDEAPVGGTGRALLDATEVGAVARSPYVTLAPSTPVRAAAAAMSAAGATAAVVLGEDGRLGLVTDRDLRARVVATGTDGSVAIGEVATVPVVTIDPSTPASDALMTLLDLGTHHLPVVRDGHVLGMLTDLDLLGLERRDAFRLRSRIERADSSDEVAAALRETPEAVVALVEGGLDAPAVARTVAVLVDAATRRLIALGRERLGGPVAPFAWLALGSAARREQALLTDQDHALVHDATDEADLALMVRLAEDVVAGLEAGGLPRCPSNVMASHPAWRGTVDDWEERLADWAASPDRAGAFFSGVAMDARQVAGELDGIGPFRAGMARLAERPGFRRRLERLALEQRAPIGRFGRIVVRHAPDRDGVVDVKAGGLLPITELARLAAADAGSGAVGTVERLRAAAGGGVLGPERAEALEEAFTALWETRLHHQVRRHRAGLAPDDLVDPDDLGPLARARLKDALRVVHHEQRLLEERIAPRVRGR